MNDPFLVNEEADLRFATQVTPVISSDFVHLLFRHEAINIPLFQGQPFSVTMSLTMAKSLVKALSEQLAIYEKHFGHIRDMSEIREVFKGYNEDMNSYIKMNTDLLSDIEENELKET